MGSRKMNARAYVARFNFQGTDQQKKVGDLSGGERNRVHLAKLLRRGCNVLLLDEPTNDLDVDTLRALEEAILNFAGCVVVISHDRWFLDRVATHILAFEGDGYVHWCEGNFDTYEDPAPRAAGHRSRPAASHSLQEAAALADRFRAALVYNLPSRRALRQRHTIGGRGRDSKVCVSQDRALPGELPFDGVPSSARWLLPRGVNSDLPFGRLSTSFSRRRG